MSLNGVIDRFKTPGGNPDGSYKVTRTLQGAYVKGRYVLGLTSLDVDDFDVTSVDDTLDTLAKVAHGLITGDGPLRLTTDDTLPAGLEVDTNYYAIRVDADTFKLASTRDDAVALTAIDITDTGLGTTTVHDVNGGTQRIASPETELSMVACIQPNDGRTIDYPPEFDVTTETRIVYTELELWTRRPGFEPDSVEIDGESWTCIKTQRWQHWGATHFVSLLVRDEVT